MDLSQKYGRDCSVLICKNPIAKNNVNNIAVTENYLIYSKRFYHKNI